MRFASKETVARLREQYPAGTRVELVAMDDPYSMLRPGDRGRVASVDDSGTIHVRWDSGSGLGIVYGVDQVKRVGNTIKYEIGLDFFRDTALSHGMEEALGICGRYLSAQLKTKLPEERQFCRELFEAMVEASVSKVDPDQIVYPYGIEKAKDRLETSFYHISSGRNSECAKVIDEAIHNSCYKRDFYNLGIASMVAIHNCGFQRVNAVLAHNIRSREFDGRFSRTNKEWASSFDLPDKTFGDAVLNAHPILLDGFADHFRKLYQELGAERFALPGAPETGDAVQNYKITRSIWFNDQRGFAIGHNPKAAAPFVCWQFSTENGARDFYWGNYCSTAKEAADNYVTRILVHMKDESIKAIPSPLATAETCGEFAPGTPAEEEPSVMRQIKAAKHAPHSQKEPGEKKHPRNKTQGGSER